MSKITGKITIDPPLSPKQIEDEAVLLGPDFVILSESRPQVNRQGTTVHKDHGVTIIPTDQANTASTLKLSRFIRRCEGKHELSGKLVRESKANGHSQTIWIHYAEEPLPTGAKS